MNKQPDNKLALSVVAALTAGIALIYILIAYPRLIFAVAGVSAIFLICAYILTQNIVNFVNMKNKSLNVQIKNGMDDISSQIEGMSSAQAQLGKATYLYTRQAAEKVAALSGNYADSQEALHKNLSVLANAQNKSTKLLIKYDQNNTTKLISTLKDIKNHLSETVSQGFEHVPQPNNSDVVAMLESIVEYMKSQPANMDQELSMQINNVARELQNISVNIAKVQPVPMQPMMPMQPMGMPQPMYQEMPQMQTPVSPVVETPTAETQAPEPVTATPAVEANVPEPVAEAPAVETNVPEPATEAPTVEANVSEPVVETPAVEAAAPEPIQVTPISNDPNKQLSNDEIAALFAAAEPAPTAETASEPEPEPVTETPVAETPVAEAAAPEPVSVTPVSDDPNKQLSADEIAALFAAAGPAPATETAKEPEPEASSSEPAITEEQDKDVSFTPTFTVVGKSEPEETNNDAAPSTPTVGDMSDPNKQLSADEIAALFAAAEPAPKKEEPTPAPEPVQVTPVSDDPNKQLSADEIAALFASAEPAPKKEEPAPAPEPVQVTPVSDDPNKQLSADEIAALFASIG